MERIQEEIQQNKKLSQEQKENFVRNIVSKFDSWNDDRQTQIDDAREIMREVYMHNPKKEKTDEDEKWKADVRINKLRSIKQAKKAAMWREIWSNPSQMFNVRGTDEQTEQNSKLQKAAIVDSMEKMKIGKAFDDAIENIFDIGEMVFITDWETRSKTVRRRSKDGFIIETLKRFISIPGSSKNNIIELPYYENARVRSISPFMFVFDHNFYERGNKKSWDSCIKIYKRFDTYENIVNNKDFSLSKEEKEDIKAMCETDVNAEGNKYLSELRDEKQYGQKIEVFYCHGDFKIGGKLYKNYIAEIVGRKYLARFEENPMFINPFILCAIEVDPLTGRGIPQLKPVLHLALEQEKIANTAIDMQMLALNPPSWVDETFIDKNKNYIKVAPGKLFKYKNGWSGQFPTAITLGYSNNLSQFVDFFDQTISDVSNVNSNMFGNTTATKRTATELSLVDKGATATVAKELDIINQDAIMPIVENVAELLAMFKQGDEQIFIKENGNNILRTITNEIREANYNYIYDDRNAIADQKNRFNELFQLFQNVGQDPELKRMIDWRATIKKAVEMIGFDNSDEFFLPDTPLTQVFEQLKNMPPEIQNQFAEMISVQLNQIMTVMQPQQMQQGTTFTNQPV